MGRHFLILAITSLLLLVSLCPTMGEVVLDIEGNPVQAQTEYYVIAVNPGLRGLHRASKPGGSCPQYVVATRSSSINLPVQLVPTNTTQGEILESKGLRIMFETSNLCRSSGVWRVEAGTGSRNEVTSTGDVQVPPDTFLLKKVTSVPPRTFNVYEILHCRNCAGPNPPAVKIVRSVTVLNDNSGLSVLGYSTNPSDFVSKLTVAFLKKSELTAHVKLLNSV